MSLLIVILLVGCINKQIFIKPLIHDNCIFDSGFSDNSFYVYVSPRIEVLEFVQTFNNKFGTGEAFSNHLRTQYEDRFGLIFDENHQTEIVDPLHELEFYGKEKLAEELKSTVRYNDIEYLIWIHNASISNKYTHSAPMMIPTAGGGMMMSGGGSTEDCVIEYRVKVVEVINWKIVNEFLVTGKKTVTFFNFESTLLGAIDCSIENAISYLITGDVNSSAKF